MISSRKFKSIETVARIKLSLLDAATSLRDLSLPGLRLEKPSGDRAGQYSIRVNDQFRVCFRWSEGDAYELNSRRHNLWVSLSWKERIMLCQAYYDGRHMISI